MRWFRREPTGRHALGAAVTAIPSGPPPVAVVLAVPAAAESVVPVQALSRTAPPAADVAPLAADAVDDVGGVPVQHVPAQVPAPPPVQAFVPAQAGPADPLPVEDLLAVAPIVEAPAPARPAAVQAVPSPPALVEQPVPPVPPAVPGELPPAVPARTGPRVELGFADGTFRMLDPQSETARDLADLVGELTSAPPREMPAEKPAPGSSGPS